MHLGGPPGKIRPSVIRREALRFAPVRPNFKAGLRAALATTTPLVVGSALGHPELAIAGLAGFSVVLADKGGAYRTRGMSMASVGLFGALATGTGMLAANHPLPAVLMVAIAVASAGFLRLFGAEATAVGTMVAMATVVALSRPALSPSAAAQQAAFYASGAAWACLISLLLWPLRVYRPTRIAIANALRALSQVAQSLTEADTAPAAQLVRRQRLGAARAAIETARAHLGGLRKGRIGPTRRAERLVAVVEAADLMLGALVAIEDSLAFEPPENLPLLSRWIEQLAGYVDAELELAAAGLEAERLLPAQTAQVPPVFAQAMRDAAQSDTDHEPRILARALERLERLCALVRAVDDPAAPPLVDRSELSSPQTRVSKLSLLRDHISRDSAIFRHVTRSTVATALTMLTVKVLALEHGYWATLTCLVILQPHGSQTLAKALQRVLGTALGAGIALVIATWATDARVVIACVFALVATAVALLPLNYGAFTVFLTPAFVLLAETQTGNTAVVGERIINTGLGAVIALLGSRLILPLSERDQIRPLLGTALSRLEEMLLLAADLSPKFSQVRGARRQLGMALLNAEASYQRLLTEMGIAPDQSEAVLTLLLYAHRIASGIIAIVFARGTPLHEHLTQRAPELQRHLRGLRAAIVERQQPHSTPEPEAVPDSIERVEVLFEQLAVMQAAALRLKV